MNRVLPGDIVLMHGTGLVESAIRFAEGHRYPDNPILSEWNHGGIVVDTTGGLIEARSKGLQRANLNWYPHDKLTSYTVLRPPYASSLASHLALDWAEKRLAEHEPYGFLTLASIALAWMTQTRFRFGYAGTGICTGFVSQCLEFAGIDMGDDPQWDSPADVMNIAVRDKWEVVYP